MSALPHDPSGLRIAVTLAWLFSPPLFVLLAIFAWIGGWVKANRTKLILAGLAIILAGANWAIFLSLLVKSQTPYGDIFQTSLLTHSLLLLCVIGVPASLLIPSCRWRLLLANVVLVTLWVGVAYAPSHFLKRWDDGNVTINGRPTSASLYIAHPWDSEAESMVLVHTGVVEDCFLNFAAETVHVEPKHAYLHVPGGVWSFLSLREMRFEQPLGSEHQNQLQFTSRKGDLISFTF